VNGFEYDREAETLSVIRLNRDSDTEECARVTVGDSHASRTGRRRTEWLRVCMIESELCG
jgi:hypothetical protein